MHGFKIKQTKIYINEILSLNISKLDKFQIQRSYLK